MTHGSLVARLSRMVLVFLLFALTIAGLGTASLLHLAALRARDDALVAALQGYANAGGAASLSVEHAGLDVVTWRPSETDPRVSARARDRARERERPVFEDIASERVAVAVAETFHAPREQDEVHVVIAARAPRVTPMESVGGFALRYALVVVVVVTVAWQLARVRVGRALAPLARAGMYAHAAAVAPQAVAQVPESGPDEVAALLRAVNALLARREELAENEARFTRDAAHELRTPLTALLGELDVALRRPRTSEAYVESLRHARAQVVRLCDLVEGLLVLGRAESGTTATVAVDLAVLVREAVSQEARTLADARCSVDVLGVDTLLVRGDAALLLAAVANLLRNAATHAAGTPVQVTVCAEQGEARVTVDDAGPGVPVEEREAVFGRMVRGAGSRRDDAAGLGLGLAFARVVAGRHGGTCRLDDAPLRGCRAILSLPLTSGSSAPAARA